MDKKLRIFLYATLGLALVGGLATGLYFGAKKLDSLRNTTSSSAKTGSSETSGDSSNSNASSDSMPASSDGSGDVITDDPTISVSKQDLVFNCAESDYPTDTFLAAIQGLPPGADSTEKGLYIYSDDDALDSWARMTVLKNGTYVQLASPYNFASGETVNVTPIKMPGLETSYEYKIVLWIRSTAYPSCEGLVQLFINNATK